MGSRSDERDVHQLPMKLWIRHHEENRAVLVTSTASSFGFLLFSVLLQLRGSGFKLSHLQDIAHGLLHLQQMVHDDLVSRKWCPLVARVGA